MNRRKFGLFKQFAMATWQRYIEEEYQEESQEEKEKTDAWLEKIGAIVTMRKELYKKDTICSKTNGSNNQ